MKILINGTEFLSNPDFHSICAVVRQQRDVLLQKSDWTQLPDVTIPNKTEWATYRQELRDFLVTNQYQITDGIMNADDPIVITFPAPPQE